MSFLSNGGLSLSLSLQYCTTQPTTAELKHEEAKRYTSINTDQELCWKDKGLVLHARGCVIVQLLPTHHNCVSVVPRNTDEWVKALE